MTGTLPCGCPVGRRHSKSNCKQGLPSSPASMRALTLTQPWAGLVASGIKLVENRRRPMIKPEDAGRQFAIHASREIDEDTYSDIYNIAPELNGTYGLEPWSKLTRISSAVIAVATLDSCIVHRGIDGYGGPIWDVARGWRRPTLRVDGMMPLAQLKWFFGPIGYVLRDVVALREPIASRGWQGFWTLPDDIELQVRAQLGERAA